MEGTVSHSCEIGLDGKSKKNPYEKDVSDLKATIAGLAIANYSLKKFNNGEKDNCSV